MSLQKAIYFAIGFGFFLGAMLVAPSKGKDSKRDIAGVFFGSILAWPVLILIMWE